MHRQRIAKTTIYSTGSGGFAATVNNRTYLPLSLYLCAFVTSATPADGNLPETIVEKDHKSARYVIWAFPIKG